MVPSVSSCKTTQPWPASRPFDLALDRSWRDQPALRIFELRTLISQGAIAPLSYIGPKSNIHTLRLQSIFIPKDSHSLNLYGMKEGLQKAFRSTVKNMKGESYEHISSNRV